MGEEHCYYNNGHNHRIVPSAPYCRSPCGRHNEIVRAASSHGHGLAMTRARDYEPYEPRSTTKKVVHKEYQGRMCTSIREFIETREAGYFLDEKSGKHGFKEEVTYVSSYKAEGCNCTDYKSEVKFQNVTTFPDSAPKTANPKTTKSRGKTTKSKGFHFFRCCSS